jgi:tetratricopeptide (TPR) repeat protein
MNRDEGELDNLSRTPRHELSLPELSEQSLDNIWDNDQGLGSVPSVTSHTTIESTEISAINEVPSNIQPELTIEKGEAGSSSLLEVANPLSEGAARKYGSRFLVQFGPPQHSKALAQEINELRDELRGTGTITLELVLNVAKTLEENSEIESAAQADPRYLRHISMFELQLMDKSRHAVDAKFRLGRLLYRRHRHHEAEIWLFAAVSGYDRLHLDHRVISALGLLLEVQIQLNRTWRMHGSMELMWILLDGWINPSTARWKSFLLESVRLARAYRTQGDSRSPGSLWNERARSLLGSIIPYLADLDDENYGIDKLEGYLEYGCSCQQIGRWEAALKCFRLARQLLNRATQYDVDAMQFVETRLDEVSKELKGCYKTPWDEQRELRIEAKRPNTPRCFWNY